MVTITIDNQRIAVDGRLTILEAAKTAHIEIPHLCYLKGINDIGACRICAVELEGKDRLVTACNTLVQEGMVIYTNTGRIKRHRKLILELLLAAHCRDCTTCVKSGECNLQMLAHRLGVTQVRFANTREIHEVDTSSPSIVRDPNKCILCGDCIRACDELQGIGALGFAFRGTDASVMPAFNKKIAETDCVNCGQCRVYCPTGAISIHTNTDEVWEALGDPEVRVVAQVAPAVRVAVGDAFGIERGKSVMGIDCSGLVQVVHAMHGMALPRDASQQAEQGRTIGSLDEARTGDLAFFHNTEGRIVHVGILLDNKRIIHASGQVKVEQIDPQGIISARTGEYTHRLRVIKRIKPYDNG